MLKGVFYYTIFFIKKTVVFFNQILLWLHESSVKKSEAFEKISRCQTLEIGKVSKGVMTETRISDNSRTGISLNEYHVS